MNQHQRARQIPEQIVDGRQAASDQKNQQPARPPQRRIGDLIGNEAPGEAGQFAHEIGHLIKETGEDSQMIGAVQESVPPGGDFAGVDESSFVGQPAMRIVRKPKGQHNRQVAGGGNEWDPGGFQFISMR